jgi:RNA polymerase sigma-70 factor (ECF subfamily)
MRNTNNPEVENALRAVATGSVEDYRIVVTAYHRRLKLWLAGYCPPGVEPEEIAHLAFLEAYRRIGQYQLGTDFYAWLCAFGRNLVRAECQKIQRLAHNKKIICRQHCREQLSAIDAPSPYRKCARIF